MRPYGTLAIWLLLMCTAKANAISLTFEPQICIQLKQLKFRQEFEGGSSALRDDSGSLTANIPTIPLSLSMRVQGKYFFQLRYETDVSSPNVNSSVPLTLNKTDVSRSDWSFNFIYSLPKQFKVLTGYTAGKTVLSPEANDCYRTNQTGCEQNLAYILSQRGIQYAQKYSEEGWYLGAAYSRIFFKTNFYFLASYAKFNSTYTDNNTGSSDFKFKGPADGFNSMISASRKVGQSMFAHARIRYQKLSSEGDAVDGIWSGSKHTSIEQITAFELGLTYRFVKL